MPSLKEVRNRIVSVQSTQQITKAMKMVAAAKLRRAQEAIVQMRPYATKLNGIISNLTAALPEDTNSVFAEVREINKVLVIAVSSDRGLCGAFNTNVMKQVTLLVDAEFGVQNKAGNVTILPLGKKGFEFFGRKGVKAVNSFSTVYENFNFLNAARAATYAMDGFKVGDFDKVVIVFNEFKNVATQILRTEQLLPIEKDGHNSAIKADATTDYIFEPNAEYIMQEVIPQAIKIQLYKALLESKASEEGARMTAMDKATDNAGELLKDLKLTYNRSRQAAITKEILEIVGGAEALAGK